MKERNNQVKIYFNKFFRLFFKTGGWKAFVFGGVISAIIAWVVGDNMFIMANDTQSGCFTIVSACIWIGIFNSIQSVCKERDIIKREHRSGMHISSYIRARARYEFIVCFFQAIIMLAICMFAFEFGDDGLMTGSFAFDVFLVMFVVLVGADFLGIAVSSIVKTTTTAMTVMPFVLIIQLVMSGVLFPLEGATDVIAKFTLSKWGMEALGSVSDIYGLGNGMQIMMAVGEDVYKYESGHVFAAMGVLVAFAVLYLVIGIISLEFVDKDKR